MKKYKFILLCIGLLLGCRDGQVLENEVKIGTPKNNTGVRFATYSQDSAFALLIVDSTNNLVSIHCLNAEIDPGSPLSIMDPGYLRFEDDETIKKFSFLVSSSQHHVFIRKISDKYHGEICCTMLENSQSIYQGTASLTYYQDFPVQDTVYVPKVYSVICDFSGEGTVIDVIHQNHYKYTLHACIKNIKSHSISIRIMNY